MSDTHLVGNLDLDTLFKPWPVLRDFTASPWLLGEVDVVHINMEIAASAIQSVLPPALNPSIPPHLSWLLYKVDDSALGPFHLVQTRIGCRVGLKPRGLVLSAFCDNPEVGKVLEYDWGFRVQGGEITLRQSSDVVDITVIAQGAEILSVGMTEVLSLSGAGVPIAAGLNLAETPRGQQLIQVDPEYVIHSAGRGKVELRSFDARAWGSADVIPTWPISGAVMRAEVTLPRLRFLIDPKMRPIEGTQRVDTV